MTRILFLINDAVAPSNNYVTTSTSGVATSTKILAELLSDRVAYTAVAGIASLDDVDHLITLHNPTHIIIETLWLDPSDLIPVTNKYSQIHWSVRDHSDSCFRVLEPNAFSWIYRYLDAGIVVIGNSLRSFTDIRLMAIAAGYDPRLVLYGPNVYNVPHPSFFDDYEDKDHSTIDIGCFSAVRLMKNHITQALAAISTSRYLDVPLRFHINSYEIPGYVDPILNNLVALFEPIPQCTLVRHGWLNREDFLSLMGTMDLCSQVSFTETFNIVTADAMAQRIPVITSSEVPWIGSYAYREPTDIGDISSGYLEILLQTVNERRTRIRRQAEDMRQFVTEALAIWYQNFAQ